MPPAFPWLQDTMALPDFKPGVSGIEVALWDLAGKAYGVPVYQLLGGRFRDRIRMCADTDWEGKGTAATMAQALKKRMAIHMAESPIGCMAAVHAAAASENFLSLEYHSADVTWWDDLVEGPSKPIVDRGFITVPQAPGLGIESLNDEVIRAHLDPNMPGLCEPTDRWDGEWWHDRTWS